MQGGEGVHRDQARQLGQGGQGVQGGEAWQGGQLGRRWQGEDVLDCIVQDCTNHKVRLIAGNKPGSVWLLVDERNILVKQKVTGTVGYGTGNVGTGETLNVLIA